MKKIMNLVIGGIEHKIFNIFLGTLIVVTLTFLAIIGIQSRNLRKVTAQANEEQQQAISESSSATMRSVVEGTLANDIQMKAVVADDIFHELQAQVEMVAQYAGVLYSNPESYKEIKVNPPDQKNDGKTSVQLLTDENVDLSDPEIKSEMGLFGNMSDMLVTLFENTSIDSCFIASPKGYCIFVDDRAGVKIDEQGKKQSFPVTSRPWYRGAADSGTVYFTDIEKDMFTDNIGIVCSVPVYHNGKLIAVAGADMFLQGLQDAVMESVKSGGFIAVVNQNGHVIFSPVKEGTFQVRLSDAAIDLRETDNKELSAFVSDSLTGNTDVKIIPVDGKEYYMAGASLSTLGWSVISAVEKDLTEEPQRLLLEQLNTISNEAVLTYRNSVNGASRTLIIALLILFAAGTISARILGKKIVRPLSIMTHKISSLSGAKPLFEMEDTFKTGDEIEILAESFAKLSRRTVRYVDEVKKITAEKERIGAELGMATAIQASQLPSIFPAFPERIEFDIYASMNPAKEVGGDFYDFFLVDDQHIAMVMADVSGKGVPAALFMMIAKILIKNRVLSGDSPAVALSNVNNQLVEGNGAEMFVTVWLAVLELSTGKGVAANAGHEHPAICRKGGEYELITYRHSPAVGAIEGVRFREHSFELNPGDSLFVYTDGVAEATNSSEELFGTERMLNALNKEPDASPKVVLKHVMDGINDFVGDAKQFDDITMLCINYTGLPKDERYQMKELIIEAKKEKLGEVLAFIDEEFEASGGSMKDQMQMDLAVEELFINVASYAYAPGTGSVTIRVETRENPRSFQVTFADRGMPYNPLAKEDPDVTLSAEERKIGGLGIFMVKKAMDDMTYEYKYGQNILTISKNL